MVSLVAVATAGGAVAITWEDCGDSTTHGKVTDLQPLSFNIGEAVTLTGTGSLDENVNGGSFKIHMEAAGLIKEDWTGDICEAKTFNLPLALGTVTWGGMTYVSASATSDTGDNLLCRNAHFTKQSELATAVEGGAAAISWEDC